LDIKDRISLLLPVSNRKPHIYYKIDYIQKHSEKDIWIILHYTAPIEKFVFIKADLKKSYKTSSEVIKQATEYYIEFHQSDTEVKSLEEFSLYLKNKIK
jgi:hypothetical protein